MGYGRSETGQSDWTWISTISSIFFIGLSRRAACGGAAQRGSPETQQFPHGLFVPACYTLMATYFFQLIEEVCRFSAREELLPLSKLPQAGRVHPHQRVRMTRVNTFWQDSPPPIPFSSVSRPKPFTFWFWKFSSSSHTCPSFASRCKDLETWS